VLRVLVTTGLQVSSGSGGCACLWWLVMLFVMLPLALAIVLNNTPALVSQPASQRASPQISPL
jgi:hypothetical protein